MYHRIPTDSEFKILDNERVQTHWVKVEVLNKNELPIASIQGRIAVGGSINIDGSSNMRRTTTFSFIADEGESNIDNVNNILSINKRIRVFEGIENDGVLENFSSIIWIPLGIFVIVQPSISYSSSGLVINLSCKDKMCLLNGECGGSFPTSITFHEYNQIIGYGGECGAEKLPDDPNTYTVYKKDNKYYIWSGTKWEITTYDKVGSIESVKQRIYDIILTVVNNYGGIPIEKIIIEDVPLEIKQIVRYTGMNHLYFNFNTGEYTLDDTKYALTKESTDNVLIFNNNEDVGYIYTDFTYPSELVTAIGDNVCTVLDKIIEVLGNYEYFFDVYGNFHFREIKNYLNNSFQVAKPTRLDSYGNESMVSKIDSNNLTILDEFNYFMDSRGNTKSVYTFDEGNGLITSYSNTPNFSNIKNDYHIWGKNENNNPIHYHVAIKEKPDKLNKYQVVYLKNEDGTYNGRLRLATEEEINDARAGKQGEVNQNKELIVPGTKGNKVEGDTLFLSDKVNVVRNMHQLNFEYVKVEEYEPEDWRAEIYLQALTKVSQQLRPDVFEQELLDLFDSIYNMKEKKFKTDKVFCPNDLIYFFDYLEPSKCRNILDYSVDTIGLKTHSYQQDKIKKLYITDIPDRIIINKDYDMEYREKIKNKCFHESQTYSQVEDKVYSSLSIGTWGYAAQETMRELLYQHTTYNESISLTCIPIYHLDVNSRITVHDYNSNIHGDYIIRSISLPLGGQGTMSITATRALERI